MPRSQDSARFDLADAFLRVQAQLLADLSVGRLFEHPSAAGAATEHHWTRLLSLYLPHRYKVAPAFIINAAGHRSRQIDIAIYDNFTTAPLFPHISGPHIPIESVYAVFEVKPSISKQWLEDAAEKGASVRRLAPRQKILTGLLGTTSVWNPDNFSDNLERAMQDLTATHKLNLGCAVSHGSFRNSTKLTTAPANRALFYFLLSLITQLNKLPRVPSKLPAYLKSA